MYACVQWPRMGFTHPRDGINYLSRPLLYRWHIREDTGTDGARRGRRAYIANLTEPQRVSVFSSMYDNLVLYDTDLLIWHLITPLYDIDELTKKCTYEATAYKYNEYLLCFIDQKNFL